MHFVLHAKPLGIALLSFISTASAVASAHDSSHSPVVHSDLHCPTGSSTSFVHNSYTYNAPVHKFTHIAGSFFNITWYGGAIVSSTTGTDKIPGATRSGNLGGTFDETLTAYDTRPDALIFTYHGQYTLNQQPRNPMRYTETTRFESICGGKATYIDIITYVCSDDQIAAYNVWYTLHMSAFQGLAATLGATVLAGDCPSRRQCHAEQEEERDSMSCEEEEESKVDPGYGDMG
ncbi:hypothetical protein B0H17DRAFT_1129519 [Mycena rosella]|uniref:Uncharacterized protein n=1 Tax=Mycena rosella TaxID=1033263 RepID=A0AAD7DV52_MYCRO|nr:hypothetical protein B0H17DRAFT_1129519 [Mycena rosella]